MGRRGRRGKAKHAQSKKKQRKLKTRALVLGGHTGGIVTEQRKLGKEIARHGKTPEQAVKEAQKIVEELKALHPGNLRKQAEECQRKRVKLFKKRKLQKKNQKKEHRKAASALAKELTSVNIKL